MKKRKILTLAFWLLTTASIFPGEVKTQALNENPVLDEKVKKFLKDHSRQWDDMNIPESDGQLLYDLVIMGNYKSALEIGTSTGHSGIWIAWALSKTGGKLITIDINERRYKTALENFKQAGLSEYIDARLADAHVLVKELNGPFDFVFSDADKYWYKNYFIDIDPKLIVGGCFTAHNVSQGASGYDSHESVYLKYVCTLNNYETTVNSAGSGVSISYKKAAK